MLQVHNSRRRMLRALTIALAGLAMASFGLVSPANAATITVNTFVDELNDDGDCSLREASVAANTDSAIDACAAGSGPDTIVLGAGVYELEIVGTDENLSADGDIDFLDFDEDATYDPGITVQGAGMDATIIDGNGFEVLERVFDIRAGDATFQDLTVRHGNGLEFFQRGGGIFYHANEGETLTVLRSSVHGNRAACRGGGVAGRGGTEVVITDSEISNNEVPSTECTADGGGVYAADAYTITNSTISDNYAYNNGGGVYAPNGFSGGTIQNSTVTGNEVTGGNGYQGAGGGLYIGPEPTLLRSEAAQQSAVEIVDTTVANNSSANEGGGLFIPCCGTIDVFDSTFSNNKAAYGGGIFSDAGPDGLGFAYLENVTVSSNYAYFQGGGIYNDRFGEGDGEDAGEMELNHVTVYRNVAEEGGGGIWDDAPAPPPETTTYRNSIIAGNTYQDCGSNFDTPYQSEGNNILGDDSCPDDGSTDFSPGTDSGAFVDPGLAPLRDNGGPTRTHALLPHSLAIDNASSDEFCPAFDQRGVERPFGSGCDIGAYEVGPPEEEPPVVGGEVVSKGLCRRQNPTIMGTRGPDRLVGTSGPDIIQGLDARDVILGKGGDDIICGSLGNDLLKGQGGDDWTKGLRGDDTDRGGPGTDKCVRGPGEDKYFSCENIPKEKQGN